MPVVPVAPANTCRADGCSPQWLTTASSCIKQELSLARSWRHVTLWPVIHEPQIALARVLQPAAAKASEAAPPGRIDNNSLMPPVMRVLNDGLVEGVDFVAVSEKSWDRLRSW